MRDSTQDELSNAKMMIDTILFYNNFTDDDTGILFSAIAMMK